MVKGAHVMLLAAAAWCMLTATAQSTQGWSPGAGCAVEGFRLKSKQLAHTYAITSGSTSGVTLYSLAGPSTELADAGQPHSLAATAAACKANPSCVMFTSDGFLVGAYQTAPTTTADTSQLDGGGGLLQWVPIDFCPGACCGTWVADGLEAQLLTAPEQGSSSGWQTVASKDLPKDKTPQNYSMDVGAMVRFCSPPGDTDLQTAQNPKCTPRCHVACCARFAAGIRRWDNKNLYQQCTSECCVRRCGEPAGRNIGNQQGVTGVTASSTADVLKRQYLRHVAATSKQQATEPKPAAKEGKPADSQQQAAEPKPVANLGP